MEISEIQSIFCLGLSYSFYLIRKFDRLFIAVYDEEGLLSFNCAGCQITIQSQFLYAILLGCCFFGVYTCFCQTYDFYDFQVGSGSCLNLQILSKQSQSLANQGKEDGILIFPIFYQIQQTTNDFNLTLPTLTVEQHPQGSKITFILYDSCKNILDIFNLIQIIILARYEKHHFALTANFNLLQISIEEGKATRSVYFPGNNWLHLFSGKRYKGNQTYTIKCNLTDTIPTFLKESFSIFLQNTDNVRNTKDLNNVFTLYSALAYSAKKNGRIEYLSTIGFISSFKDHHNQSNIDRCIKSDNCYYYFVFTLAIDDNKKTLIVTSTRKQTLISEEILLEKFVLYYDDKFINFKPQKPLSITGSDQNYELTINDIQQYDNESNQEINLRIQ